ncbi:pilus assembly protein PilP [Alteromonas sp. 345S023]|uniref:Pilus assembly protein PilP n=1 Tax=Alteromonas profundi TaxID=2696062 RepID=A0A7X5RLV1_9ALTE|nr:pilus assembly protein PilP [Alteromonas profundi]NDV92114.1 pilus assembly protein PilP [Alteromonas profundi]
MKTLIFVGVLLLCTTACSPQLDDLAAYTENVRANAVVNIEPYPEFKTHPSFVYSAGHKRSPFIKPKDKSAPVAKARQANCLQPDFQRSKTKLEAYGLDALAMAGRFNTKGVTWALITSNDGVLHKVKLGSRIGLFYGKVTAINKNSITIEQLLPDGAGCWQKKETRLTAMSSAGEE